MGFIFHGRRSIWWGWRMLPVVPRIVTSVSCVKRIQHGIHFFMAMRTLALPCCIRLPITIAALQCMIFFSIGLLVLIGLCFFYRLETSAPGLSGYYWYLYLFVLVSVCRNTCFALGICKLHRCHRKWCQTFGRVGLHSPRVFSFPSVKVLIYCRACEIPRYYVMVCYCLLRMNESINYCSVFVFVWFAAVFPCFMFSDFPPAHFCSKASLHTRQS